MSTANVALLERYPALWSSHDVEGLLALFTDDCEYEDAVLNWVHRGKAELRDFAANVFALHPDFRLRYLDCFATATRGAAEWIIEATIHGEFEGVAVSGTPVSFRGSTLFEFQDGRIRRNVDFWNYADWMRQLGVLTLRDARGPSTHAG